MPCIVKKTLEVILESNNHYLVKVKANQPKLLASLNQTIDSCSAMEVHIHKERSRGRKETRTTSIYYPQQNIPPGWLGINTILLVEREFIEKKNTHCSRSIYITDLPAKNVRGLACGIRGHWYIENKLHYTKDVTMREDTTSTKDKKAAANLTLFRNIAFNILKTKHKSIKYATELFANTNLKELFKLLYRT
jgi:predicted transposase YbfD/YdcC